MLYFQVRSSDKEKVSETRVQTKDLVDHLLGKLSSRAESSEPSIPPGTKGGGTQSSNEPSSVFIPEIKVSFNTQEKLPWNMKKRYESLMRSKINPVLSHIGSRNAVEVLGVIIIMTIIKIIIVMMMMIIIMMMRRMTIMIVMMIMMMTIMMVMMIMMMTMTMMMMIKMMMMIMITIMMMMITMMMMIMITMMMIMIMMRMTIMIVMMIMTMMMMMMMMMMWVMKCLAASRGTVLLTLLATL